MRETTMGRILIISHSADPSTNDVVACLTELGAPWTRINTDAFATEVRAGWSISADGLNPEVWLSYRDQCCDGDAVSVVWYRRHAGAQLPTSLSRHEEAFVRREIGQFWHGVFRALEDKPWVNDWRASRVSKPEQLQAATRVGLQVPPTLVTNDATLAREFALRYGPSLIVKPVSFGVVGNLYDFELGLNPDVQRDRLYFCFTRKLGLEELNDPASLGVSPVIIQPFIKKEFELRITAVGEHLFSVAMLTGSVTEAAVDWRRLGSELDNVPHVEHRLPADVEGRILALMQNLHLQFGCIDMIVTPNGEYIFLEVNPFGQWGWTEGATGLPITQRLAELLAGYASSS